MQKQIFASHNCDAIYIINSIDHWKLKYMLATIVPLTNWERYYIVLNCIQTQVVYTYYLIHCTGHRIDPHRNTLEKIKSSLNGVTKIVVCQFNIRPMVMFKQTISSKVSSTYRKILTLPLYSIHTYMQRCFSKDQKIYGDKNVSASCLFIQA